MIIVVWCCSRKGQPHPAAYRGVDCGSAWNVTWWKKAWMRACRAPSAHQANVSIREYKKGGGAPNPHLPPITVSCPSPRPISSHYRPMWIPGKFLRPNFFRPIDSIWPGSFDVLSVNIMVIGYYHPHSTVDFIYVRMTDEAAFDMNQFTKRFHIHYYILYLTYNDFIWCTRLVCFYRNQVRSLPRLVTPCFLSFFVKDVVEIDAWISLRKMEL